MRILIALLLLGSVASAAPSHVVVYTAKNGDTPESVAADYYGNRSQAIFLIESNGLERDKPLKPGRKSAFQRHSISRRKGDTLEGLAQKFLDDKRRAVFLAAFSRLRGTDKLREGQELVMPFQHVHRAELPESVQSVARAFYGDASKAKLLADYNFRTAQDVGQGRKAAGADRAREDSRGATAGADAGKAGQPARRRTKSRRCRRRRCRAAARGAEARSGAGGARG